MDCITLVLFILVMAGEAAKEALDLQRRPKNAARRYHPTRFDMFAFIEA